MITTVLLISISTAFAGNGNTVHSLINKQIKVPATLKHQKLNEKVNVQFTISANGNVSIINIETNVPELKKYVTEQFKSIDFKSAVNENKEETYFIDINFKVL
jgi:hypothetical protein